MKRSLIVVVICIFLRLMMWNILCACWLSIFFGEMSIRVLGPVFIGLFAFFLSNYRSYLYIMDTRNGVEFIGPSGENFHVNDSVFQSVSMEHVLF